MLSQPSKAPKPPQDAETILVLRRGLGIIGIAMPFVLAIGNMLFTHSFTLIGSISASYFTQMRDVFVGMMFAMGVFLICYRYDFLDDLIGTIAGVLAILVALFRTTPDASATPITATDRAVATVHMISAIGLFLLLATFCIFLFTRSGAASEMTPKKKVRNGVYYACGGVILGAMVLALISLFLPVSTYDTLKPLFWCESVAVVAFGAAWLVKGETIFKDSLPTTDATTSPVSPAPVTNEPTT